jgi:alpha-beta hydrolase superfamily lysophospholipase
MVQFQYRISNAVCSSLLDENGEYFARLKALVEETYRINDNQPVIILAHSMGGPMSLHFLHTQTKSWKDKYICALVTLSGAWGGAVKALKVFAVGKLFVKLLCYIYVFYCMKSESLYTKS